MKLPPSLWIDPEAGASSGFFAALEPVDQVGLVVVGTFFVLGAVRGLWWQVIRLAGLVGAGVLARCLAPRWSPAVSDASGLPPVVAQGLAWFVAFVLGLVVASLLGLIGKKSLETMQLGLVDRFGGALAGALTGLVLQAAVLVGLSYLGPQPWTADTLRGTRSETLLRLLATRTPLLLDRDSEAAREIRGWLGPPPAEESELEHIPQRFPPEPADPPPAEWMGPEARPPAHSF